MNRISSARESARFSRIDRTCSRSRLIADMPTEIRRYERESAKWHVLACIEAVTVSPDVQFSSRRCERWARHFRSRPKLRRYFARLAVAARLVAADRG